MKSLSGIISIILMVVVIGGSVGVSETRQAFSTSGFLPGGTPISVVIGSPGDGTAVPVAQDLDIAGNASIGGGQPGQSVLVSLEIQVDGAQPVAIDNADIDPDLPQIGPAAVNFQTRISGLYAGFHQICVIASGTDPSGSGRIGDCVTVNASPALCSCKSLDARPDYKDVKDMTKGLGDFTTGGGTSGGRVDGDPKTFEIGLAILWKWKLVCTKGEGATCMGTITPKASSSNWEIGNRDAEIVSGSESIQILVLDEHGVPQKLKDLTCTSECSQDSELDNDGFFTSLYKVRIQYSSGGADITSGVTGKIMLTMQTKCGSTVGGWSMTLVYSATRVAGGGIRWTAQIVQDPSDYDGDGATNALELAKGTNPLDPTSKPPSR